MMGPCCFWSSFSSVTQVPTYPPQLPDGNFINEARKLPFTVSDQTIKILTLIILEIRVVFFTQVNVSTKGNGQLG